MLQHFACFGLTLHLPHKLVVAAVADGAEQRPRLRSMVIHEHRSGQVLGVRIDGKAKQQELKQRNADHHAKGHAVPPHLDELLDDDRQKARDGKIAVHSAAKLSFD